mgnify:FL=1|jgi:uncharacterized protein (TIGR02687 family)
MAQDNVVERIKARFNRINKFETKPTRIVFWVDKAGEFKDTVDDLNLGEIKILKMNGYNSFKIKYMLEHEDSESRYLIYVPYEVPNDSKNILADTMHYCEPPFCADKPSLLCMDLNIPSKNAEVVKKYIKFFNNADRRKKFQRLDLDLNDEEAIIVGIMAVVSMSDSDHPHFQDILRDMLQEYSEDPDSKSQTATMDRFESYELTEAFWTRCSKEYGTTNTTMGELVRTLFISYASCKIELKKMMKIDPYVSKKSGRISTFINGMYNDTLYCKAAEKLSDWVSKKMKLDSYFNLFESKSIAESDAFRCIDEIVISRLIGQMSSTCKPLDGSDIAIVKKRMTLHYRNVFEPHYNMIDYGQQMIEEVLNFSADVSSTKSSKDLIDKYSSRWYLIDRCYRGFVFNADKINEKSGDMESFIDFIENTYNNRFLNDLSVELCTMIKTYDDLPDPKQTSFYNDYVQKSDQATVVIISDAFRYECATELRDELKKSSRVREQKLDHMISTVPSITKFGMAALLPNNGLQICPGDYSVKINGMNTNMDDRESVLRAKNPDSVVLKYKQLLSMKTDELRNACRGKRIVYIYHNEVDATGDNPQTEVNTFTACSNAIGEIKKLIEKITNGLSYTRFIITSDHGFIYRRKKLDELDKIQLPPGGIADKRYVLSESHNDLMQSVEMSLEYLGREDGVFYVSVPNSSGIFKVPGAGQNFVHGGMSPQEIVVPVLIVHTNKGKVTEEYVGLKTVSKHEIRKMQQNIGVWQEHPVSDKYREATYDLYFEDEDGRPVSDVQSIIANRVEGQDMEHHARFTFSIKKGVAYLVIKNKTDEDIDLVKEEYRVNVMFTDLGGI